LTAKRTEEVALELRRHEREEEAMWELAFSLREVLDALPQRSPDAERLLQELNSRWRTHLAAAIRSGAIAQQLSDVRELAHKTLGVHAPDTGALEDAIKGLLVELQVQTSEKMRSPKRTGAAVTTA